MNEQWERQLDRAITYSIEMLRSEKDKCAREEIRFHLEQLLKVERERLVGTRCSCIEKTQSVIDGDEKGKKNG